VVTALTELQSMTGDRLRFDRATVLGHWPAAVRWSLHLLDQVTEPDQV
jgi:hypothetical protein